MRLVSVAVFAAVVAMAQQAPDEDVFRIGPGIVSPKLTHKEEPRYPESAIRAGVQGRVLLEIVVDRQGIPQDIAVISPLGFGLDESAIEVVSKWRFKAGLKDGKPVKVRATVEISFQLADRPFNEDAEKRRTSFNVILARVSKTSDQMPTAKDVAAMEDLAKSRLASAYYALGLWQLKGLGGMPQDTEGGLTSIRKAADMSYGPAMFFIGKYQMLGRLMPNDTTKGLSMIRDAAVSGSWEAQLMLGKIYEKGDGVDLDASRAKQYFQLCAASGKPECQFDLSQLLINSPGRKESDWLQGVAWLELAQGHNFAPAKDPAAVQIAKLTPEQDRVVAKLRGQLERKP